MQISSVLLSTNKVLKYTCQNDFWHQFKKKITFIFIFIIYLCKYSLDIIHKSDQKFIRCEGRRLK